MGKFYSVFFASLMTTLAVWRPMVFADLMFLELWPSLLWAVAIGLASTYQCAKGYLLTFLLALLPVIAGSIYFGIAHASDDSFLLAGVIPWSDAWMHFRQAAQMALYGITQTGMNGRFLYPAYFSSLLEFSSCNLLLAEALGGLVFSGALLVALRETARFIGALGAGIVALVCWLFFRERCSGLIMTENLGLLCGVLSLAAFLIAIQKKEFVLFLLGVFMLSLGLCARPGALLVLPLLVLFAGFIGWSGWLRGKLHPIFKAFLAAMIALLVIVMAFSCNTLLAHRLYKGKVITNQNFSFTLYGLLTGGKWSDCLTWSHWDSQLVMRENLRLIKEQPELLFMGALRAYKETLSHRTLFQFHHESRPATLLLLMALLGLVALWKNRGMHSHALWMTLMTFGIILSIPFAPPWDAAERPFAATVPFQALLAGIGFYFFLQYFFTTRMPILGSIHSPIAVPSISMPRKHDLLILTFLTLLVFFLTVAWPLLHQQNIVSTPMTQSSEILRLGSFVRVTSENRAQLEHRMIPFLEHYPNESELFALLRGSFILGIDWGNKDVARSIFSDDPEKVFSLKILSFKGWHVDQRLLPQHDPDH